MRVRIEEILEIVAVAVITISALTASAGFTVYDRIHKAEEIKKLHLDHDSPSQY